MPKLAQILKQSSGTRQVCVSIFFHFWSFSKTNRFHTAVGLFSNRLQSTSKCGTNICSDQLACGSCATSSFFHILMSSVIYYWTDAQQHGIYLLNGTLPYEFTTTLAAISSQTWLAGASEVSSGICRASCIWMAIMNTVAAFINV